jgi:hypothetical protein
MNINELNQLIPDPYREITVPETFLYYRNGSVFPISGQYISENGDFIFKYSKNNGAVEIQEAKPSEVPQTIYTAEEWVQKYFSSMEVIALTRLEQSILIQGKSLGLKMSAVKQWLESMMFAQPSNSFAAAPYTYSETSMEAATTLAS